ncbi:hypothetical protein N0V93_006143 [Gnomoniopsis smithogilvyi]|uniref:Fungal lipase-type domain-containing protein n=1 Tax=Gnomoniopsis smithogilvyi TaxID=1191159 RepID=A0A9W9CUG3_9PEZI|nr:hypothetical protein N0V93_006143 [Gnomoniopsis smithogilvyi]
MGFFSRSKSKAPPAQPTGQNPVQVERQPAALGSPPPQRRQAPPPQYSPAQVSGIIGADGTDMAYSQLQTAGSRPPLQEWNNASPPPAYQQPPPQQAPIVVNQHYYLCQPDNSGQGPSTGGCHFTKLAVGSAVNLTNQIMPGVLPAILEAGSTCRNGSSNRTDGQHSTSKNQLYHRFNEVMTLIDCERYAGNERDLFLCQQGSAESTTSEVATTRGQLTSNPKKHEQRKQSGHPKGQTTGVAASVISGNYFAKVELYANSRLPMNLPPLKLYIPTWPLLCLAAQYSEKVYEKARGKERDVQIEGDHRNGGKAMVIKSVPMDHMNTIVFAIRGTSTFMDWAVNLNTEPASPAGFLDDDGNFCHAGFLSVARRMISPVAARLRQLLRENPSRRSYSLLITGHSAGGAVASLLYAHMLSTSPSVQSELNSLTESFKRVHCVTFGTPPVSLLPLQKPSSANRPELNKSLFLSFVNEGDPVARADKAYVRSLLDLFATPVPALAAKTAASMALEKSKCSSTVSLLQPSPRSKKSTNSLASAKSGKLGKASKSKTDLSNGRAEASTGPIWKVPSCTLSNAGRIVVLRSGDPRARLKGKKTVEERLDEGVVAQIATDEQLRTVIWGDPVCHLMKLYAGRLEILAVNAVTAKGY